MEIVVIIIAVVLACIFPACLIDAIRSTDEDKAYDARNKACVMFGIIVLCVLLIANSSVY